MGVVYDGSFVNLFPVPRHLTNFSHSLTLTYAWGVALVNSICAVSGYEGFAAASLAGGPDWPGTAMS